MIRLDEIEKDALIYALEDFDGEVYLFGSRLDRKKKGGDIDLLLLPREDINPVKLSLEIQTRFFMKCEQDIDVIIYTDNDFCKAILKDAKRLNIKRI